MLRVGEELGRGQPVFMVAHRETYISQGSDTLIHPDAVLRGPLCEGIGDILNPYSEVL